MERFLGADKPKWLSGKRLDEMNGKYLFIRFLSHLEIATDLGQGSSQLTKNVIQDKTIKSTKNNKCHFF